MNLKPRRSFRIFLILVIAIMWCGCGSSEEKKAKRLAKAQEYAKSSEYNKAAIEYKNVIQIDPKDAAAHYQLGEVYLKLNRGPEALVKAGQLLSSEQKD